MKIQKGKNNKEDNLFMEFKGIAFFPFLKNLLMVFKKIFVFYSFLGSPFKIEDLFCNECNFLFLN